MLYPVSILFGALYIVADGNFSDWDSMKAVTYQDRYAVGKGDELDPEKNVPAEMDEVDIQYVQVWSNSTHIAFRVHVIGEDKGSYKELLLLFDTLPGGTRGDENTPPFGSWDSSFMPEFSYKLVMDVGGWYTAPDADPGFHFWNGTAWEANSVLNSLVSYAKDAKMQNIEIVMPLNLIAMKPDGVMRFVVSFGGDVSGVWIEDALPEQDGGVALMYYRAALEYGHILTKPSGSLRVSVDGARVISPDNSKVKFTCYVPVAAYLKVQVFDVSGRFVRTLEDGVLHSPGDASFEWDGRNDGGELVPPGIYILKVRYDVDPLGLSYVGEASAAVAVFQK